MEETVFEIPRRRSRRHRRRHGQGPRRVIIGVLAACLLGSGFWWLTREQPLPGQNISLPDYVEQDLLPVNQWSRPGTPLENIDGVVIHYVGNPGTTAQANRNYFAQPDTQVSAHFLVGLDGEVIQCIPLEEKSSATNERNRDTISIEVCHPDASGQFTQASYDTLVRLTAWLCDTAGIGRDRVIRHYDVTGKACPLFFVEHPDTWTQFLADVAAA